MGVLGATSRLNTRSSRTRRAMAGANWLPKSGIRTVSEAWLSVLIGFLWGKVRMLARPPSRPLHSARVQALDWPQFMASRALAPVVRATAALCAALAAGGVQRRGAQYSDPTPEARIGAIRRPWPRAGFKDIPYLVECLSSDDPAVRLAAVDALQRLAGTTLGYRASAPPAERTAAVTAWKSWVIEQGLEPAQAVE